MKVKLLRGENINGQSLLARTDGGNTIMIDAGMDMKEGKPIPLEGVEKIDYLFITHAHLDHSGSVPEIKKKYCPQIILNEETEGIMNILFADKMYNKAADNKDGDLTVIKADGYVNIKGRYDFYEFALHPFSAGHIVGASSFMIEADGKIAGVSGDVSMNNLPTVNSADVSCFQPDVLFLESTYGGAIFPDREKEEERLANKVDEVLLRGGNVLIPAFSVGRTQDVALILKKHGIAAYIDGMGRKIADAFGLSDIRRVIDYKHREKILSSRGGNVIIVAAGFLGGGFVLKYLKGWAPQRNSAILFPSPYQGDLGKAILGGAKSVTVRERYYNRGQEKEQTISVQINAEAEKFSLSSHADQAGLVKYAKIVSPKKIILIHGEMNSKSALKIRLEREITNVPVVIAKDGDEYEI